MNNNLLITESIKRYRTSFLGSLTIPFWNIPATLPTLIEDHFNNLNDDFIIRNHVAIHRSAVIEEGVVLKGPIIISEGCFIGAHAYLRGGVFLDEKVSVGPGCEIKSAYIFSGSGIAHFNFVGDSIIGSHVNMEAGAIIANHFNEREDKHISFMIEGKVVRTQQTKFGAVLGDHTKIGANAVLSPGTILSPASVVKRLELIEQVK